MRLSEAIRLGSMLRPQSFRVLFGSGGSCAFGAAYEATGLPYSDVPQGSQEHFLKHFSWAGLFGKRRWFCPACESEMAVPSAVITHLNDDHRWTREQIADWVQTIEPAQVDSEAERAVTRDGLQRLAPEGVCVGVK